MVFEAVHLSTHLEQLCQGDIVLVGGLRTLDAGTAEAEPRIDHVQRGGLAFAEGQLLQAQVFLCLGDAAVQQQELLADLLPAARSQTALSTSEGFVLPPAGIHFEALERSCLEQALHLSEGNRTKAARLLQLNYKAFLYRLEKYQLDGKAE